MSKRKSGRWPVASSQPRARQIPIDRVIEEIIATREREMPGASVLEFINAKANYKKGNGK